MVKLGIERFKSVVVMYDQGHTNPLAFDISPTGSLSPLGGRNPRGMRSPDGQSPGIRLGQFGRADTSEDKKDAATILMWSVNAWYKKQKTDPMAGAKRKLRRLRTGQVRAEINLDSHGVSQSRTLLVPVTDSDTPRSTEYIAV
jgi:hypothetical protein